MAAIMTNKPHFFQQRVVGFAAVVAVLLLLLVCSSNAAEQQQLGCNGQGALVANCREYVTRGGPRKQPSAGCCAAIQEADLQCLCNLVTLPIAAFIDIGKVCYVARTCGASPPPAGSKCGVVTVPNNC